MILGRGGVREVASYRSAEFVRLENSVAWWASLATWGALLLVLAGWIASGLGLSTAIGGFLLFLVAAVAVGDEQFELATALGGSAVIWTSAGVSPYLGADRPEIGAMVGFTLVGCLGFVLGVLGSLRARAPRPAGYATARSDGGPVTSKSRSGRPRGTRPKRNG